MIYYKDHEQKTLDTPSPSVFSLFFIILKLYFNTEDIQTMKEHTLNYVVNKKVFVTVHTRGRIEEHGDEDNLK